jgi:hypothetical protein
MTAFLSATRERFLGVIASQVQPERIAEIHFLPPMVRSGVESGVAVIAARRDQARDGDEWSGGAAGPRHTVYTADYRLVLKGPERGKWEASVVEEADAPLLTVETVVRGVQERAGDTDLPLRMDGEQVRAMLNSVASRSG